MYQFSHSQRTRILIMHQLMSGPVMVVMAAVAFAVMLSAQASAVVAQEEQNAEIPDWAREAAERWLEGEIPMVISGRAHHTV